MACFRPAWTTWPKSSARKGIKAEAIGHLAWKSTASKIVKERAAGKTGRLVLVGHSQGANNVIEMARELETHKIPVELLITLAPFLQDPVPSNVVRALNYYQSPGWGTPLTADPGFKGELSNIDIGSDSGIFHINIDKNARVQAEDRRRDRRPATIGGGRSDRRLGGGRPVLRSRSRSSRIRCGTRSR